MWTRVFAFAGVSECVSCATLCNIFFLICFRASPSACECLPLFRRHSSVSLTPSPLFYSLHPNVPPPACDCISVCVCVFLSRSTHTLAHIETHLYVWPTTQHPARINQLKIFYADKGGKQKTRALPLQWGVAQPLFLL